MTIKHEPPLVLIADDQIPTTVLLERVFEHEGYQIKSVYDGLAAIEAARSLQPDLLLLDVNMPGMNGFDVLRELRENPVTSGIPTILITAQGESADIVHGLKLGADDYLRKPFQAQELLARAQSKMKSRQLEESLQRRTQDLEALLRVSEELNQHLETDELMEFILYLALDLLSSEVAAIYRYDPEKQSVIGSCLRSKDGNTAIQPLDETVVLRYLQNDPQSQSWPILQDALFPDYQTGIITPLQHGGETRGLLLVLRNGSNSYDENHLRLMSGVSRQAALALRNAELYEIQLDYAQHLEDMVAARTAELESAQKMLIRSEKLASLGRLAASIAHEINNPLFPIKINLEHMLEDIQDGRQIDASEIEHTQESVERIRRIVNRLLEFAGKRQNDDAPLQMLDTNTIIENVLSLNRKFFQQENIEIDYKPGNIPPIDGNRDQLEQVLMNLTLNAKAAMESGGRLGIQTFSRDEKVYIEVMDNGHGIPEDMLDKIFEPFVSTKEDGTGLGLFISYGIIQNHNGDIQVESEPDSGTKFTIVLPTSTMIVEEQN